MSLDLAMSPASGNWHMMRNLGDVRDMVCPRQGACQSWR